MSRLLVLVALVISVVGATDAKAAGTVVEYYHAGFGHFFITAFPDEAAALDANPASGWARTGNTFSVETDPRTGLSAVCRFFSAAFAPKSSHFYTPYADECEKVKGDGTWTYEAVAFYLALPDSTGRCQAGTAVLYRLYNNGMTGAPNHRYTTDAAVFASMKAKGWIPEGNGVTGAFACTPSNSAAAVGNVSGEVELQPNVRVLTAAQRAELLSVTADTVTFATPVGINRGDVFVIDDVGAFLAVSVSNVGGWQVVGVLDPTVDELFAKLSLSGSVPLSAAEFTALALPVAKAGGEDTLPTPKKASVAASTYKGAAGVKAEWVYELPCDGPNGSKKMEVIAASIGIYGDVRIENVSLTTLPAAKLQAAYVVPEVQTKIGCKIKGAIARYKVGQWAVPVPGFLGVVRVHLPVFLSFNFETDVTPVVTIGVADSELAYTPEASPVFNATVKGSLIGKDALVKVLAPSATYSAKVGIEVDTSARLVVWRSYHLASIGAATGPAIELKASLGATNEVCAKLIMPTRFYADYRFSRSITHVDLFKKDFDVDAVAGTCVPAKEQWHLTYESCSSNPVGCASCASEADLDMLFSFDKSTVDGYRTNESSIIYRLFNSPAKPLDYFGCGNATLGAPYAPACDIVLLNMTFEADYKNAVWTQVQTGAACTLVSTGRAGRR